jgi:hypothetical protein
LKGETLVENDRDVMIEFTGFARQLEKVGVDYSIVVSVDGGPVGRFGTKPRELERTVQNSSRRREEISSGRA